MSAFLINLVARARGGLRRLEPRRPAPFEAVADRPEPDQPTPRAESGTTPAVPEVPAAPPSPSSLQAPQAPRQAARVAPDPVTSAPARAPVSATPAPIAATRRMAAGPLPAPVAGATPASTKPATALDAKTGDAPPLTPASSTPAPAAETRRPQPVSTREPALPEPDPLGVGDPPRRDSEAALQSDAAPEAPAFAPTASVPVPKAAARIEPSGLIEPAAGRLPERAAPAPLLEPEPARSAAPPPDRRATTPDPVAAAPQVPTIEVHIGTIDIVGETPQTVETPAPAEPMRGVGLDDYLDGTWRG